MVVEGGFRVELVDAINKIPYKEHTKDGKTYVEGEPDAEYFVSLQKIAVLPEDHYIVHLFVDDQNLGWYVKRDGDEIDEEPNCFGLFQRVKKVKSSKALKFVKPQIVVSDETEHNSTSQAVFGTVTVKIYKASSERFKMKSKGNYSRSLLPTSVNFSGPVPAVAAKISRSGEGDSIAERERRSSSLFSYRKCEELVSEIILHYCSAVGLIHVGVLPKPDIGKKRARAKIPIATHKRIFYCSTEGLIHVGVLPKPDMGKKRARAKIPIVTHKRVRRASTLTVDGTQMSTSEEYNDLLEIPSDDDSDEEGDADG
jgi:hypothetical protein